MAVTIYSPNGVATNLHVKPKSNVARHRGPSAKMEMVVIILVAMLREDNHGVLRRGAICIMYDLCFLATGSALAAALSKTATGPRRAHSVKG